MTARFDHGLVLGKFYPPHLGHHHLIRTAAAQCRRVTVVVLAADCESLPLDDRVTVLRAVHADDPGVRIVGDVDNVPVDYDDPDIWTAHVAITAAAVVRACLEVGEEPTDAAVDAVFSSEPYGDELARRFGATAVCVDLDRRNHPVSGSAVRTDVVGRWHDLAKPTQALLARRVVVVGAESTGTTTLARELAEALADRGGPWAPTTWVPEHGRAMTAMKLEGLTAQGILDRAPGMDDLCWTAGDFTHIAEVQLRMIDEAAQAGSPVVVADTDALATGIWHERYRDERSAQVEAVAARRYGDLYLLTDLEGVPFEDDGMRDGEHLRPWMHARFAERLAELGLAFTTVTGERPDRVARALAAVDDLVAGMTFSEPMA